MLGPDIYDDTADDHERIERDLLAQDWDAHRPSTARLDDETAQKLARELLNAGTVTPVVDERVLVHEPSDAAFESIHKLAGFHEGWTAATSGETES